MHEGGGVDAAQCRDPHARNITSHGEGPDRRRGRLRAARGLDAEEGVGLSGQPDRQFRRRRSRRRLRAHRPQVIVDTYGGYAPHGGGAFSGKDPTKVDRSAAYAARYLAKNVVAAGIADRCTIQIAYAIGVADPMSLLVDTHGTSKVDEKKLEKVLPQLFRLTPTNIRRALKLCRPIYRRTAAYGHFGRAPDKDGGFSWEKTDLVKEIRSAVGSAVSTKSHATDYMAPRRPPCQFLAVAWF